ncbi:MAG: hypothetical protein IJ532_03180 [Alphaproteobacteria bacterium]|nr:hypothetical protein [Alphaproteobacteria bacterium]
MVKQNVRHYLTLGFCILAIVAVAKCQVVETTWHRAGGIMAEKRSHYRPQISAAELDEFTKRWPEFNELGLLDDIDLSKSKVSDVLTWKMRIWFVYRHWDAERFFYVRSRLLHLLNEIKVRREAESIIKHLQDREDSVALQMINLQKKRIKAQKISSDELLLLSSREKELNRMFKQYP